MNPWLKRRWWELRVGHGSYLVFALTFVNFVLIAYRLLIEQVPQLNAVFPHLWLFAIIFLIVYAPAAVLIGHWHKKSQLPTEQDIGFLSSPLWARLYRLQLQVMQGTASKEEVEQMMQILRKAEKAGT